MNYSEFVDELTRLHVQGWWQVDDHFPQFPTQYSLREQMRRERLLSSFLDSAIFDLSQEATSAAAQEAKKERLLASARKVAIEAMDLPADPLDAFLEAGFTDTALDFARKAREYDPQISAEDIYQAGRNAWSMNLFQYLFGLPVRITPAVFAYSLLYPYSDNYLDDPGIPSQEKRVFGKRLSERLKGEEMRAANLPEERIFRLVEMIEADYPRASFPYVYESLLAIHRAQVKSLRMIKPAASPYEVDVLQIDLEKGGTATLADGYLVAGDMTREQAEFLFGYGAFTQLMDDQEDIAADLHSGLMTPFSQTTRGWKLDAITNRLFGYSEWTMAKLDQFNRPEARLVSELVRTGIRSLLVDTAGRAGHYYSTGYLRALETHNPFRFSFLKATRKRLAKKKLSLARAIEALI